MSDDVTLEYDTFVRASAYEKLAARLRDTEAENARLREACSKQNDDVCQVLGKALGYPWYKDDQANFPGADESNGVCVGDHVAESIADEAAKTISRLREDAARVNRLQALVMEHGTLTLNCFPPETGNAFEGEPDYEFLGGFQIGDDDSKPYYATLRATIDAARATDARDDA